MLKRFIQLSAISILSFTTINAKDTLIVTTDDWPPFRMTIDNTYKGIDFDLWKELSKELNIKIDYKNYPWARSLINMRNGSVDGMSGLAKKKERQEYIKYTSTPYYSCSPVFYTKKGLGNKIKKYEDLENYLIGYVDNSAYFKRFDEDENLNKRAMIDEDTLLKMLSLGRLKVIIGTDCQADYQIKQSGLKDEIEKTAYKPNSTINLYLGISRKSEFINKMDEIDQALNKIVKSGKINTIVEKYYGK